MDTLILGFGRWSSLIRSSHYKVESTLAAGFLKTQAITYIIIIELKYSVFFFPKPITHFVPAQAKTLLVPLVVFFLVSSLMFCKVKNSDY